MKIAVWHNLPSGGGKRALYSHVQGLLARGHTIEIWCPQIANRTYLPLAALAPEHVTPLATLPDYGANPLSHALLTVQRISCEMHRMDVACQQAAGEIRRGNFDLLFANSCQTYHTPAIGRFLDIPSVLYLQEPDRHLYEAMPRLPWIGRERSGQPLLTRKELTAALRDFAALRKARLRAEYEQRNARSYDSILVNSFFSRESLLRAYGKEARVCYLGIDTDHFVCHAPDRIREDFVIGLGALQVQKNIAFVIQALAHLPIPRPRLLWVGNVADADYVRELRHLAMELGVCLEIKVMLSEAEVVDLLNRAAMMVYAPRLEPFGYAPLEANACGLAVVGVAEGGVRETIQNGVNGLLVEGDRSAMAQAIERLWNDPDYARQLGNNGRQRVQQHWSLTASIDRLETRLVEASLTKLRDKRVS